VILRKKKKKWHVRLALKFEFFKSPLDLYNHKKNFEHIKMRCLADLYIRTCCDKKKTIFQDQG
jgi:hypothetical protein